MTTEHAYDDSSSPLGSLLSDLSDIIETFVHLGVQVHDFQGTQEAKLGLANNINRVIGDLSRLSTKEDLKDITIPVDIINYVEDGRNPDVYTREFVELVRKLNQYLNGKTIALQRYRDTLATAITKEFPELTDAVQEIKTRTNLPETESS